MSIKIYDGKRIFANSLEEAVETINKIKPQIQQMMADKILTKLMIEFITMLDMNIIAEVFGEETVKDPPKMPDDSYSFQTDLFHRQIKKAQKKGDVKEDKEEPENISMIIFPQKYSEEGKTFYLLMPFSDREYTSKIETLLADKLQEYGYWNNSEGPEELTEEQWALRREQWCASLVDKGMGIPIDEGLEIRLAREEVLLLDRSPENLTRLMELLSEKMENTRPNLYIKNQIISRIMQGLNKTTDEQNDAFEHYNIATRMYRNGDYSEELKIYQKTMIENLKIILPTLNAELCTRKLKELKQEGVARGHACVQKSNLDVLLKNFKATKKVKKI